MEYDIFKGYTIIDGFAFTALTFPCNVHDAIIIKCEGLSDCEAPQYDIPLHTIGEYTEFINKHKIEKAIVILNDIAFLPSCPSLVHLNIIPSYQTAGAFDFSPLYQMPQIKSLFCQNQHGRQDQILSEIDYSKIQGLIDLGIVVNKGTLSYNKIQTLKSLDVGGFRGRNRNLTDLFCSRELDTLEMIQCGMHSLEGIDTSKKMQCLYLHYNRSLKDISALRKVKHTLRALRIENCPKIEDFSVLGELENLELLELSGRNALPSLDFLKSMKRLSLFVFDMNVLDGDLSPCLEISHAESRRNRKHYNLKNQDLPKGKFKMGNEDIDEWRKLE